MHVMLVLSNVNDLFFLSQTMTYPFFTLEAALVGYQKAVDMVSRGQLLGSRLIYNCCCSDSNRLMWLF